MLCLQDLIVPVITSIKSEIFHHPFNLACHVAEKCKAT